MQDAPRSPKRPVEVSCPYCTQLAELVDGAEVGRMRLGMVWLCRPCDAWVPCHPDSATYKPLGRLAKRELRTLRVIAGKAFDRIWVAGVKIHGWSGTKARKTAYRWLAKEMGVSPFACQLGYFDEEQMRQAIGLCESFGSRAKQQEAA